MSKAVNVEKRMLARAYRDQGLTYAQVAEKLGVSKQRVAQLLGQQDTRRYQPIKETCIYPNLRAWMNDNKVSRSEFLRRMGLTTQNTNAVVFNHILRGEQDPRKSFIDKMIEVTGLPYETLFKVIDNGN